MTLIRTDSSGEMGEFSGFVEYLHAAGLAERTVRAYAGRIIAADTWFSANDKDLTQARIGDLIEFAETIPFTASSSRLVAVAKGLHPQGTAILVGLYLALRAHEIAAMRFDRFDPSLTWYRVIGKGGTDATLP